MLDVITTICWAFVYILTLCYYLCGINKSKIGVPFLAVIMNVGWELNANITSGCAWEHVLWLVLDLGILVCGAFRIRYMARGQWWHICVYVLLSILAPQIFFAIFRLPNGMLVSSFAINLFMSLMFVIYYKQIMTEHKLLIVLLKMAGTLCSTILYGSRTVLILPIGIIVFLLDLFYFALCLEEQMIRKGLR